MTTLRRPSLGAGEPVGRRARLARAAGCAFLVAAGSGAGGCSVPDAEVAPPPTFQTWRSGRERLAAHRLRAARERTLRVALRLREPFTGRLMQARGAVALSPPGTLRMVLLGPGGTTALDLWLDGGRFRFAVPALDLLRRGDASTPRSEMRGLPVDFLGWWLLRPFEGTLLWFAREAPDDRGGPRDRFLLRDREAVVDLRVFDDGKVNATRSTRAGGRAETETVEAGSLGCGAVVYTQTTTGLRIEVACEGEEVRAPSPRAFVDPDADSVEPAEEAPEAPAPTRAP